MVVAMLATSAADAVALGQEATAIDALTAFRAAGLPIEETLGSEWRIAWHDARVSLPPYGTLGGGHRRRDRAAPEC